jgi:hypothetical protein
MQRPEWPVSGGITQNGACLRSLRSGALLAGNAVVFQ